LCVEVNGMSDEQGGVGKGRRTTAEIEQIVSEYESSGLNRSQFCRGHGLTLGTLNRYLRRLRVGSEGEARDGVLVAVELAGKQPGAGQADSWGLAVVLRSGRKIAVGTGFDSATLRRVVQVLEAM
jgi:hypothetical protein